MSLIKLSEAASVLGVSRTRLRDLINSGTIVATGTGPARRVDMDSIRASGLPVQGYLPGLEKNKKFCPFLSIGRAVLQPCSENCGIYCGESEVCSFEMMAVKA